VRFNQPNFEYAYQVFDLRHDSRSRLIIVDWFDTGLGQLFSAEIGEQLVMLMPTKATTRKQISIPSPSDLELFQLTEIFKASRDRQPARFFEIYDEFNEPLKREPLIAKYAVFMAVALKDTDRFQHALEIFADVFSQDPNFALMMSDFFIRAQSYEDSYVSLSRFHANFSIKEGAIPARLSALALALGKMEDAEKYAVEATEDEPSLELGWWSLLRARARAQDHAGALAPLAYLEDNFGHRLDEAKLRRDRFQGFATLVSSEEFKEWRAGRD
jgi:tetratricopeptide (TPR) repeat protein